jgi:hypothetical protein
MKVTSFVIILLSALSLVFAVLYFAKPREVKVEVPVPQLVPVPAKPDTVYLQKIKFVQISAKPDTEYAIIEDDSEPETVVSEKTFKQSTAFGELNSLVRAYSVAPAKALYDSIWFPAGEKVLMDQIKKEILEQNKPKSKFWTGAAVGSITVLALFGTLEIITN